MRRQEAVEALVGAIQPTDLVVCCNGMIGRELFTAGDRPQNFYMIGSMGLGLSIAMGVALSQPQRRVIALDGDGNVLMGLSSLATAATEPVHNLLHVVLDNGVHGSTGGQRTISRKVQLEQVALAAGYRSCVRTVDVKSFQAELGDLLKRLGSRPPVGPSMLLAQVEPGNVKGIGRVTVAPADLAERFAHAVQESSA